MVFIVDDNFIGNKKRVRELLVALVEWRARTRPMMGFLAEASVNLADQSDLLDLMARAPEPERYAAQARVPGRGRRGP